MTRKDYNIIASVLNDAYIDACSGTEEDVIYIKRVIKNMADALYDDNQRFIYKRFYLACGIEPQEMDI